MRSRGADGPVWIWMDPAATCNLSCSLCYTISMQSASLMELAVFTALVDRFDSSSHRIVKIHLNWRGEPTSNPRLADMLAHLRGTDWPIEWHTNGTLLTPARAAQLIGANPKQTIFVSLDGGTAGSFEQNRGKGTWEKALRGAEALLAARGQETWPRIGIYQIDLGVALSDYDPRFRSLIDRVDTHIAVRPIDEAGREDETASDHAVPRGPCFWLGNSLAIDASGHAWTCLLEKGTRIGSLLEESVDDVLDRAAALRSRVDAETRSSVPGCSTCRKRPGDVLPDGGG